MSGGFIRIEQRTFQTFLKELPNAKYSGCALWCIYQDYFQSKVKYEDFLKLNCINDNFDKEYLQNVLPPYDIFYTKKTK